MNKEQMKRGFLIISWALYDLANQFFALNVVSLYFVRWVTLENQKPEIFYSLAFGISTFVVAIAGPVLGAISDIRGRHRPFLINLTLISIVFTMLLGVSGNVFLGLLFFMVANFGCQTAIVFYNALMLNVAPREKIGLISGLGKMFGYSGAILALYLIKPIVLKSGYQATFLPTGILFLIFSLPCMIFVKDRQPQGKIALAYFLKKEKLREIFLGLKKTAFDAVHYPGLLNFLQASFFGLCAVNAVILFMSVYATRVFGLGEKEVINLIGFSTFFAILGSISFGFISDYLGHKRCLNAVLVLWLICFLSGGLAKSVTLYFIIGALVGITLGATWVVSRALAVSLAPPEKMGEVFGLFNLVGYLAAIVGTLFWGAVVFVLSSLGSLGYRVTLLSLSLFIILGLIFLNKNNGRR